MNNYPRNWTPSAPLRPAHMDTKPVIGTPVPVSSVFDSPTAALTNVIQLQAAERRLDMDSVIDLIAAHRGLESFSFTSEYLKDGTIIPSAQAVETWLRDNGFVPYYEHWVHYNEFNQPVARVRVTTSREEKYGCHVHYNGDGTKADDVVELIRSMVVFSEETVRKGDHTLELRGIDNEGNPDIRGEYNVNTAVSLPEFYPSIDGGMNTLIREFMESNESVLILAGPPGTGKTTGIVNAARDMGVLPCYVTRSTLFTHPKFVDAVISFHDNALTNIGAREPVFMHRQFNNSYPMGKKYHKIVRDISFPREEAPLPQVAVVVVEDADMLLSRRTEGNAHMAQLLNVTDGAVGLSNRKIIFTTNLLDIDQIEPALLRPGRCFGVFNIRELTADEATTARAAAGLEPVDYTFGNSVSLAEALRPTRRRIEMTNGGRFTVAK